jgi:fermentation-respiration switch protein FrsA (DUF1100 family)
VKKWLKITLIAIVVILVVGVVALFFAMRPQGRDLVRHPLDAETRQETETPADIGIPYDEVAVTTEDGLNLVGWYIPSQNGASIIAQHGFRGRRHNMLYDAEILHRHRYGVLVTTVRAHDRSDGDLITFGKEEMKDLEAWYQYLLSQDSVDPDRIGIFGESMGGMLVIQYAAQNENIKAVVSHSAFASLKDTAAKGVQHLTGLPAFPFAPMILFWAEREADIRTAEIDTTKYIGQISPRPVFIMMGGQDDHISIDSGQWLYDAAGEPKEFWFEPEAGHHGLPEVAPEEYERRVVAFFDQYLAGEQH